MNNTSNKLDELEKKIKDIKDKEINKQNCIKEEKSKKNDFRIAMNCMLELISGFVAGGAIGYGLDKLFQTNFVFFIIFVVLGFVAGLINLNRYLKRLL